MGKYKIYKSYLAMTSPGLTLTVLVSTALGFYFAQGGIHHYWLLGWTLLATALTSCGATALNQYLERDTDALMLRTQKRPLPMGEVSPARALEFGTSLILIGLVLFAWKVNLLTAFLSMLACFLYVLVYTPFKKVTWLNSTFGALAGAIPPLGGWAATGDHLGAGAWVLFFILFTWQHPHFYSIAWINKEDYRKAGLKMLPVVFAEAEITIFQIILFSFLLVAFSLMPSMMGMAGKIYFWGALAMGAVVLYEVFLFKRTQSQAQAQRVLGASIIYLPLLLALIITDGFFK